MFRQRLSQNYPAVLIMLIGVTAACAFLTGSKYPTVKTFGQFGRVLAPLTIIVFSKINSQKTTLKTGNQP